MKGFNVNGFADGCRMMLALIAVFCVRRSLSAGEMLPAAEWSIVLALLLRGIGEKIE